MGLKEMSIVFRQRVSVLLLVVASVCLLLSPILSFMAGCAGDTKGGSLGNITLALHYGGLASLALFAGLSFGSAGFVVRPAPELSQRAAYAAAWFFFSGILFLVAAFQAEVWGVQSCF